MRFIELFAGCGGLSLGLKSKGFELLMANEISPMASETYTYNFFDEALRNLPHQANPSKTFWLKSQYPLKEMDKRLREDPRQIPKSNKEYSELTSKNIFSGGLVVGNIAELNKWIKDNPCSLDGIKNNLDLVSGGPPCQSFSMAGLRQLDNSRNTLPWEFIKFVDAVKPNFVLLENVTGILRAFKVDDKKYLAWYEVAKSFAKIDYIPLCLHINAKYTGVAQNRPRFILIGIKKDIFDTIAKSFNQTEKELFDKSISFHKKTNRSDEVEPGELKYFDITTREHQQLFTDSFLRPLAKCTDDFVSVEDAIDDLRTNGSKKSKYTNEINSLLSLSPQESLKSNNIALANHELRNNSDLVKRRFRIYQIQQKLSNETLKESKKLLKGDIAEISNMAFNELKNFEFLTEENNYKKFENKDEIILFFQNHQTSKQTQKALVADKPAPATLSIPDDSCHYHKDELRTLTVREMARIQSFPDGFEFCSKVTTGGKMREFEVPQYTQVGNAVPPLLGRALGQVIMNLNEKLDTLQKNFTQPRQSYESQKNVK